MIPINRVQDGMARFVEQELCSKMDGWQKAVVATAAGLLVSRLPEAAKSLPLGLSSEDGIDVEAIYNEARKHIDAPIPIKIPYVGTVSLTRDDLDTLYRMM